MSFWTSPSLQPLKQNRFRIVFTPSREMMANKLHLQQQMVRSQMTAEQREKTAGMKANIAKAVTRKVSEKKKIQPDFWWNVKTCTLPSFEVGMSEYQLVNHKFKYPGMVVWNDISITMVDTSSSTELLMSMLGLAGYGEGPSCMNSGISKGAFAKQGEFRLQMINAQGTTVKQWRLSGWFFRQVRFGELSYESDDLVTLEMTLGYDYAVLENNYLESVVGELQKTIADEAKRKKKK